MKQSLTIAETVAYTVSGPTDRKGAERVWLVSATVFGAKETTHNKINMDLGKTDDPATKALFSFLKPP